MTSMLHAIGERLLRFLEQALQGRDPDRDVPAAEEILRDLVDAISGPGLTQERWAADLVSVVEVPVKALVGRPEHWNEAVKLTAIYFSSEWRREHPFANMLVSQGAPGSGELQHPVSVELQLPLLEQLLARADERSRAVFFAGLSDHQVINALGTVLPRFDLTSHEIFTLVHRVEENTARQLATSNLAWGPAASVVVVRENTARQLATGDFYQAIFEWSKRHASVARTITEAWLEGDPSASLLSRNAVFALVRATVIAAEDLDWRDKILGCLDGRFNEEDARLAVFIANLAWPEPQLSDVRRRHDFLISRVKIHPELLVGVGIQAMFRDALDFPLESFETAMTLWGLLSDQIKEISRQGSALALIALADRAVRAARKNGHPLGAFLQVLEVAIAVPPAPTTDQLARLDSVLEHLVDFHENPVRRFLARWLIRYHALLVHADLSIEEMFPLLIHKNFERVTGWLLTFMISSDRDLRLVASVLFGRQRSVVVPPEFARSLSEPAARALAHVLVGGETLPGSVWIPCLIDLARVRPDLLDLVKTLLLEDAASQYSGVLRRSLGQWNEAPWSGAAQEVLTHLDRRRKEWQLRLEVPELSFCPSRLLWLQREEQALGDAYRRAQGKSVFLQMVTRVPIARGEASSWTGASDESVPFKAIESSVEFPMLDVIDPVEAKFRRHARRREAENLIAMLKEPDA